MKVGLTGGIGCGKSTVARIFRDAGWRTLDSDKIVAELLSADESVQAALREHWGEAVFSDDGQVDRRAIAARVFKEEDELFWLEQLLHPRVRKVWQSALEDEPEANWLVEIPLIFEKRLETAFDFTVCVASPSDVVENRMTARGYTGEEVERRRMRQMPLEEKIRRSDYVITNAGSIEFLEEQTLRLIERITAI